MIVQGNEVDGEGEATAGKITQQKLMSARSIARAGIGDVGDDARTGAAATMWRPPFFAADLQRQH
jgi:hypothetical protein